MMEVPIVFQLLHIAQMRMRDPSHANYIIGVISDVI